MTKLFTDSEGKVYSEQDVRNTLRGIGADDCETLFIHSDVMFGRPIAGFKKKEYLNILYSVVKDLGVKYLIVPTFTYSFCNKETYDVRASKTTMGAFNEYVRNLEGRYRTKDPLLSVSVPLALKDDFDHLCIHSLGAGSGLDVLHKLGGVKFLFFGAEMADCFTYVHYIEKMLNVPYRFDMPFDGQIILEDGTIENRRQYIHTQCYGVKLPKKYDYFEAEMEENGFLRKARLGDKYVACMSEKDAYEQIRVKIMKNPYYFLAEPYSEGDLIHKYTYDSGNGRITHC